MNRMRVIRIGHRVTKATLVEAVAILKVGGVVAFPTETAYGLAADPTDARAVKKIYAIKGRVRSKGLPLIAASFAQAQRIVRLPRALATLARQHWPGPLTVVAPLAASARKAYRHAAEKGTVAVRVSASAWARALAHELGRPITATSANVSGAGECYSGAAVRKVFAGHIKTRTPDLLLDGGIIPKHPPSTIVTIRHGKMVVLRQGAVRV